MNMTDFRRERIPLLESTIRERAAYTPSGQLRSSADTRNRILRTPDFKLKHLANLQVLVLKRRIPNIRVSAEERSFLEGVYTLTRSDVLRLSY